MIKIELNREGPDEERWILAINFNETGFPQHLSTHLFVDDALEEAKTWLSTTVYL